jgi:hypothetical protein
MVNLIYKPDSLELLQVHFFTLILHYEEFDAYFQILRKVALNVNKKGKFRETFALSNNKR